MPLIDKPLEELKTYQGTNPKPADFDAYWEKALAELDKTAPNPEYIPAKFQAKGVKCYDTYFTGVNGARVYAKCLMPDHKEGEKLPAVLSFHGYSGASGGWSDYLGYALSGFVVYAMDARGQGGKSEDVGGVYGNTLHGHIIRGLENDDPQKLLFRDIFLDTAQLARLAMDMDCVDETRVGAFGGSQGGALTIACASLEPRIKKAAPQFPFLCDYKRVWDMDLDINAYAELKEFFRHTDPRHEREDEWFTKLGYIDLQYLAPRIKAEIKMATGLMDTVCPPSTQFAAYNKMTCKKSQVIYPDFGHEGLPGWGEITYEFMAEML